MNTAPRKKGAQAAKPEDFFPNLKPQARPQERTPEELKQLFLAAFGK